jgi:hypothetical protein
MGASTADNLDNHYTTMSGAALLTMRMQFSLTD